MMRYLLHKLQLVECYLAKKLFMNFLVSFFSFFFFGLPLIILLNIIRFMDFLFAYTIKIVLILIFLVERNFLQKIRKFFFFVIYFFIYWIFPIRIKKFIFFLFLFIVIKSPSNLDLLNWDLLETVKAINGSKDNVFFFKDVDFFDFRKNYLNKLLLIEKDILYSRTSPFRSYNTHVPVSKDLTVYRDEYVALQKSGTRTVKRQLKSLYGADWPLNLSSVDYWSLRRIYGKGWLPFEQIVNRLHFNSFFFFFSEMSDYINIFIIENIITDGFFVIIKYYILDFLLNISFFDFLFLNLKENFCFIILILDDFFLLNLIICVKIFLCSFLNLIFDDLMGFSLRIINYFQWDIFTIESFLPNQSNLRRNLFQVDRQMDKELQLKERTELDYINDLMFNHFLIKNKHIDSNSLDFYREMIRDIFVEGSLSLKFRHYVRSKNFFNFQGLGFFENFYTFHPFKVSVPFIEGFNKQINKKFAFFSNYNILMKPLTWSDFFLSRHSRLFNPHFNSHVFLDFFDYFYESRFEKNVKYNRRLSYFNRLYWNLVNYNEVDDYNRFRKIPGIMGVRDIDSETEGIPIDRSYFRNKSSRSLTKYRFTKRNFFSNDLLFVVDYERAISFSTHNNFVGFFYKCLFNFYFIFIKSLFCFFSDPIYYIFFYFLGVIIIFFFYFFFLRVKVFYFLFKRFVLMIFLWSKKKNQISNLNLELNEIYNENLDDDEYDEDDEGNLDFLKVNFKVAFLIQFLEKLKKLKRKKKFNYFLDILKIEILLLKVRDVFLVFNLLVFCLFYFILSSIFFSFFCFFNEISNFIYNFVKKLRNNFINLLYSFKFFCLFIIRYIFKIFTFEKLINIIYSILNYKFLLIYLPILIYRLTFDFFIFLFKFFWFFFVFFLVSFIFFLYYESYLDLTIQKMLFKYDFQDLSKIYNESQILTTSSFKNTYMFGFEETPLSQTLIISYIILFIYFLSLFFDKFNDNFLKSPKSFIYQEDSGIFYPEIAEPYELNLLFFDNYGGFDKIKDPNLLSNLILGQEREFDFNIISVWRELLKRVKINSFFLYKMVFLLNSEVYFFNNFRYLIMNLNFNIGFLKKLMFNKKINNNNRNYYKLLTKKKIRLLLVLLLSNKQFFYFKFTKKNLRKIFDLLKDNKIKDKVNFIKYNFLFLILLKNLEFFLSKIRFDRVLLNNNNLIKKMSFFNRNLSKKELQFKFTSYKIKLVLNPFKYNAFMFNNIRVFEKGKFEDPEKTHTLNLNYEDFYPLNQRINWSLPSWYRKFNSKRTKEVIPNGSFYFWSFYVGFFHSHVFFKTYNDSLRFLLNKWKFPRVIYDSLLDVYFQSSIETRYFGSRNRNRVKYGTLNIKSVAIYFPYIIDEFMFRDLNKYLFKHLRSLYRFSSNRKNEQTVANFKARYKELLIYNTFNFNTETFYYFEFYVKSFLFYLKNRFYFNEKSLYKVINQFFRLKKKKKFLLNKRLKKNLTSRQLKRLKYLYRNIGRYLKFKLKKKSKFFCFIKELFSLLKKKKYFMFFFFNNKGYLKILKRKKISLYLQRKNGKFNFSYNLKKRKRYKLSFKRFESLFNYFYYRKNNINFRSKINKTFDFTKFKYLTRYFKFNKMNKFKIIVRRKNIGNPFIKNLKMVYIKLQGKSFILLKKYWRKNDQNFDLGYVLFLLKKRTLWFDRFDFKYRRHIKRARFGFNYKTNINDFFAGHYDQPGSFDDEASDEIYFSSDHDFLDEIDEVYEDDNVSDEYSFFFFSEYSYSELFLTGDDENRSGFLNPLTFFEFKKSINQTDKDIIYDSFWLTDIMVDRCLINSVSMDSFISKDRFVVSNLSIYSNFLNFKYYSIDFDSLTCESNLLRNFIFHIWNKIPNTIIRNFFDFRLLRYSYPFLNTYSLGNFDLVWPAQRRFNRLLFYDNVGDHIRSGDPFFNVINSTLSPSYAKRSLFERGFFFLIFYNPYNKFFLNYIKEYLGIKVFPISGDEIYSNKYKRLFFSNVDFYIKVLALKTYPDLNKEDFERVLAFFGCTLEEWDSIDNLKLDLKRVYDDWEFPIFLWCMLTLGFDKLGSGLWTINDAFYKEKTSINLENWFMLIDEKTEYNYRTGEAFFDNSLSVGDTVSIDLNYSLNVIFYKNLKNFLKGVFEAFHEFFLLKSSFGDFQKFKLSYIIENIERFFFFSTLNQSWLDIVNLIGLFRSFFFFLIIENNFLFLGIYTKVFFVFVYIFLFFLIYLNFVISFFIFCYIKFFFQIFFLVSVMFDLSLINLGFLMYFNFYLSLKYVNMILDFIYLFIFF